MFGRKKRTEGPVFMAAKTGDVDLISQLIDAGADVNKAAEGGDTPLYMASQNGHTEVVKLLDRGGNAGGVAEDEVGTQPDRARLFEMIEYRASVIEKDEGRTRADAEYLSLCSFLDDLATRPNGLGGYKIIMDLLTNEYSQHHNDVITYLAAISGKIKLTPEAEEALIKRHK